MKATRQNRQSPASLVIVSSGRHLTPDISEWSEWDKRDGGILLHFKDPSNWPSGGGPDAMYAISKLLLMYAFEDICKLAVDEKGEPEVIVKSVCPGICNTDLQRTLKKRSLIARMAIPVLMSIVGKSPELGGRYLLAAALAGPEKHGKFIRFYLTDEEFRTNSIPVITSPAGRRAQAMVWKEVRAELAAKVPGLQITASQ
ncbi:short-chain dehydrogenase reductase [Fusarium circinatum]|uniref:Short-chain dehydrogenase reductase n=1 Tax=Fusarium circinatum TaxID=48490 RepID=A0A8H5TP46_FUSCI|nr:short-chain dehydrogenase reductase [Fusarium circinatum]